MFSTVFRICRVQPEIGGFGIGPQSAQAIPVTGQQHGILALFAGQSLPDRAQGVEGAAGGLLTTAPRLVQQGLFLLGGQLAHLAQGRINRRKSNGTTYCVKTNRC